MERSGEILEAVEILLAESEFEVVDVECVGGRQGLTVRVYVDKPSGGVTLDDCARVSRAIEDHFETAGTVAGRYVLEVSSPGVDRPLRKPEDFRRFRGETARLATWERIDGRHKHVGVLAGYDEEKDVVLLQGEDGTSLEIPRGAVKKANLQRDPWDGRR